MAVDQQIKIKITNDGTGDHQIELSHTSTLSSTSSPVNQEHFTSPIRPTSKTANNESKNQQSPKISLAGLPTFSGTLQEDLHLWAYQFLAFCRVHEIPDEGEERSGLRNDLILLALVKDSPAERFLIGLPVEYRSSWKHSLAALQQYFASPSRRDMAVQAALNVLYRRSFRDDMHRGESVRDLISDFEKEASRAGLTQQRERLQMFCWAFRKYTAASQMLRRATTLDAAFREALRWERVLVEKAWSAGASKA